MKARRFTVAMGAVLLGILAVPAQSGGQAAAPDRYILPPESVQDLFGRDKNFTTLDEVSPDRKHFLIPLYNELTDLDLMAQKTYRLGMLEFCPEANREWRLSTYGAYGLKVFSLDTRKTWAIDVPPGVLLSDVRWSPDGSRLAFLVHRRDITQVWTADVRTGRAQPLSDAPVMATLAARPAGGPSDVVFSRMLQWTADGSVLALIVPPDRGPEPQAGKVPEGPLVRRTREKPTPTSTQPFLLRTPLDEALFRHYTTAQMALLAPGKPPRPVGRPAMYLEFRLSPDGKYILREQLVEPFSYLVGYSNFGRELDVVDLDGKVLSSIRKVPLQEASNRGGDRPEDDLPRDVSWRPDGKGLSLLWQEEKPGTPETEKAADSAPRNDRIMFLPAPFDLGRAQTLVTSEHRFSKLSYSPDGRWAFVTLSKRNPLTSKRREDIAAYDLSTPRPAQAVLVKDTDPEDVVSLPGEILTTESGNGVVSALLATGGTAAYLRGEGFRTDFKSRPFIDRVAIQSGKRERVFEGSADWLDRPLAPLDNDLTRLTISREGKNTFPDSYLWSRGGATEKVTENKDPYPEITAARRVDFEFTRRDGVKVQGRISLPVGYQDGTRVPAVFWTYPSEFASEEEYARSAIRSRSQNACTQLSFLRWSDIWLTQGYALVYPDIPIIGKGDSFNDNYLSDMVDSVYAAIRKVDELGYIDIDRMGHGGHSYGAFTTANMLAHTPFFKAGIAGDGAYNRSLTPMTFQGERRSIWEAPETYSEMSPFFYADHINSPLLMYHGAQDNNSGTFLIQSERMIQALTGLGKNAVLYVYPYESHAPRARENFLDLWARWLEWFDKYVKSADSGGSLLE